MRGGTRINIEGDGFFEAERIKVSLDMSAAVEELDHAHTPHQDTPHQGLAHVPSGVYGLDTLRNGVGEVSVGHEMRLVRAALDPYTGLLLFYVSVCVCVYFDNGQTYTYTSILTCMCICRCACACVGGWVWVWIYT